MAIDLESISNATVILQTKRQSYDNVRGQTGKLETPSIVVPFSEWSDAEINQERWDTVGKDAKKTPPESRSLFTDNQIVLMPPSITVHEWKRLGEVYPNYDFAITSGTIDFSNFKNGSQHVLHSEFMRSFVFAVGILEYASATAPWPIESVSPKYSPNTSKENWKPWHHIYSHCKAGKGAHSPNYNRSGKYALRLHWMGCWRKIYVDDLLPVDAQGKVLLPNFVYTPAESPDRAETATSKVSSVKQGKRKAKGKRSKKDKKSKSGSVPQKTKTVVQLWPFLLCKALLKIASLSWNEDGELIDFVPLSCLTGWLCQKLDTLGMSSSDIWNVCEAYAPKFEWEEARVKSAQSKTKGRKKGSGKKSSASKKTRSKSSKRSNKTAANSGVLPYTIVASCFDVKKLTDEPTLSDIPAIWPCDILIEQTRDVPLTKPPPKPELARWKRFRWIAWAVRKGIVSSEDDVNLQCLKLFSSLSKCPASRPETARESAPSGKKSKSSKSRKSSKGSKGKSSKKGGKKKQVKVFPQIDRSIWTDFGQIQYAITCLYVFFKPSSFRTQAKITDATNGNDEHGKEKKKDKKGETLEMFRSGGLHQSRNEPIYVFADSLDSKLVVLSLSQMGNVGRLCESNGSDEAPWSYLVVEHDDWRTNRTGEIGVFLNTYATKTAVVYFKPGRLVCKIWIKSDNLYVAQILSETPLSVGSHQDVIDVMTNESQSLTKLSYTISGNFGRLVQSYGTAEYLEALRALHSSYLPDFPVSKSESSRIHDLFVEETLRMLPDNNELASAVFALKVLFLDPSVRKCERESEALEYDPIDPDDDRKMRERAATKIQAIFKRIFVGKLLGFHDQTHRKYLEIYENLKKIYAQVFAASKRNSCGNLLRNFLGHDEDGAKYSIVDDLASVVDVRVFGGTTQMDAGSWAMMSKREFRCTARKPQQIGVYSFCNLRRHMVRVFDNDSGKEIPRFTNNACVWSYRENVRGFTVLSYGWAEAATTASWKLYFVGVKGTSPCFEAPDCRTYEKIVTDYYKPNVGDRICRCVVTINQNVTATFRLATSCRDVKIGLRCFDAFGRTLTEIVGVGNVILPLTRLTVSKFKDERVSSPGLDLVRHKSESRGKIRQRMTSKAGSRLLASAGSTPTVAVETKNYWIEAVALDDSWPLTRKEWTVALKEKKKLLIYAEAWLGNEANDDSALPYENPYWQLRVVHNSEDALTVSKDTRREEEIKEIKRAWYKDDSERPMRSKRIREEYLRTHDVNRCGPTTAATNTDVNLEESSSFREVTSTVTPIESGTSRSLSVGTKTTGVSLKRSAPDRLVGDTGGGGDSPNRSSSASWSQGTRSRSSVQSSSNNELLIKWIPETDFLPPFDLTRYNCEELVDPDDRVLKTDELEEERERKDADDVEEYFAKLSDYQNHMERIMTDQIENFVIINDWYAERREESADALKSAYKLRDNFIDSLTRTGKSGGDGGKKKPKEKRAKKKKT